MSLDLNLNLDLNITSYGDPTIANESFLSSLGFATTRTGAMHDLYNKEAAPGNYRRRSANEPLFMPVEVEGKRYPSLFVPPAATPLIRYSADLTNAAWTKTNCTAELRTGSLENAGEASGHTLLTATAANALCARTVTRASAARQCRARIAAPAGNTGSVFVSHGKPTGSEIIANGTFDTDTTGWVGSHATLSINSGKLRVTSTSAANASSYQSINVTPGKLYVANIAERTLISGAGSASAAIYDDPIGGSPFLVTVNSAGPAYFRPTNPVINFKCWILNAEVGSIAEFDGVSLFEVDETEIPAGTFADIALDEYTGANPQYAIRLTDDEDTAEVYDIQGFELATGTPPPWCVPQGATPAAVGASTTPQAISVPPTSIDVDALVSASVSNDVIFAISDGTNVDNSITTYFSSSKNPRAQVRVANSSDTLTCVSGIEVGETFLMRTQVALGLRRITTNGDDFDDGVETTVPIGLDTFRLGTNRNGGSHGCHFLVALRDNSGQLLGSPGKGFNLEALQRYKDAL